MATVPPIRGIFRTDIRARAAYAEGAGIYRIIPSAIARPADVADVATLVRWAAETRTPIIPRGAGSAMAGGNVGDGVILDLTGLAERPLSVDPAARTIRTGTQVTLAELNAAAEPFGLRLPPDPSSGGWATVGGMIGTNASGPRTLKYGSVRRWVEGVEMVMGGGEMVELRRRGSSALRAEGSAADDSDASSARRAKLQAALQFSSANF